MIKATLLSLIAILEVDLAIEELQSKRKAAEDRRSHAMRRQAHPQGAALDPGFPGQALQEPARFAVGASGSTRALRSYRP